MFYGFQDTGQITKLFHSPSIDELIDAVCEEKSNDDASRVRDDAPAHSQRALTSNRWPGQSRSGEARRAVARR